ncbi:ATP-binding protein [Paenibacillus sp. IITD108]|uniref:ATP-binding protein n=1 Tax=Paenibacillus sp. IITD108 TaxID=3116649 RepID=UPI002F3F5F12
MVNGKKLLVIGGPKIAINIVKKAQEMGIYTIVTDQFINSPAKVIADESYMVSTYDTAGLVELCKKLRVDGVITGYFDSILPHYQEVCEQLNMPCYATKDQFEISVNKNKFKKACIENGIPVVPEFRLTSELLSSDLEKIEYPVLVKPADNCGTKGISVCNNELELRVACTKALEFSSCKEFLVEKYMDYPHVEMDYHLDDGKIVLETMWDKSEINNQKGYASLPEAFMFPSNYLNSYINQMNDKVIKMFKNYGFKNGLIFLQAFVNNGSFYFFEMGYRLGSAQTYKFIEKCCGYNPLELLIRFSLTGSMTEENSKINISPYFNSKKAVQLICLLHEGTIKTIDGFEEVQAIPEVIHIEQKHFPNDEIKLVGTYDQILARIYLVSENVHSIIQAINKISKNLRVYDVEGNNQLFQIYDANKLYDWSIVKEFNGV